MAQARTTTRRKESGKVVAKEAIVIVVGARPIQYGRHLVIDRRTNEPVEIDNHNDIVDEGDEGVPYAFKAFQKVDKRHPAVAAAPDAFLPLEDVDDDDVVDE